MVELSIIAILYILGAVRAYMYFDLVDRAVRRQGYELHKAAILISAAAWPLPTIVYLLTRSNTTANRDDN